MAVWPGDRQHPRGLARPPGRAEDEEGWAVLGQAHRQRRVHAWDGSADGLQRPVLVLCPTLFCLHSCYDDHFLSGESGGVTSIEKYL